MVLLDCTLRDGGYYNDWDFPRDLVQRYLRAVSRSGVNVVELGFRGFPANRYLGPTAYTTDSYLESLDVPGALTLGVMVNARDLITYQDGPERAVPALFNPSAASRVGLVRIAADGHEVALLEPAIAKLREFGYPVGLNLMKVHRFTGAELFDFGEACKRMGVHVAYFADSFGGLRPEDIDPIVTGISSAFSGPTGCHLHDNMSMGLANSLAALNAGATWVDGTILGMGRGPGNARTEFLALELTRLGLLELDASPLIELVTDDFGPLQRRFGWGTNVFYFMSALYGVHPSYVQELAGDARYGVAETVGLIERLRSEDGVGFDRRALDVSDVPGRGGSWCASGFCDDREVLIVGPGPSGREKREDIERYIERTKPLVIALNLRPPIASEFVEAYAVCNPVRAQLDSDLIAAVEAPVFIPHEIIVGEPGPNHQDFGMTIAAGEFNVTSTGCTMPRPLAAAYALAVAMEGGASRILLTGFDGYGTDDPRQAEMVEVLDLFTSIPGAPAIVALTPSTYPVAQSSLFAE